MADETFSLDTFYSEVNDHFRKADMAELEKFLFGTVAKIERLGLENTPEGGAVFNEVASWLRGVSRYDESKEYYERAIRVLEACGQGETDAASRMRLNYATLHRLMGNLDAAEELYEKVIHDLEQGNDPYALVSVYNNLSLVYQDKREYERALEILQRVLGMLPGCPNVDEHEIATTYVNIAGVQMAMKDYEAAEQSARKAIDIFDSMKGEDSHLASAWTMLATILYCAGKPEQSLEAFEHALELDEKYYGKNVDYARISHSIARVNAQLGNKAAAIESQKCAVAALTDLFGAEDPRTQNYQAFLESLEA